MSASVLLPPPTRETRVRFMRHAGNPVLLIDLSNLVDPAQVQAEIRTARDLLSRQAPGSQCTLTLVGGAARMPVILDALLELAGRNRPRVRAGAVVGMDGIHRALYRGLVLFSRRNIESFERIEPALEWLAREGGAAHSR